MVESRCEQTLPMPMRVAAQAPTPSCMPVIDEVVIRPEPPGLQNRFGAVQPWLGAVEVTEHSSAQVPSSAAVLEALRPVLG